MLADKKKLIIVGVLAAVVLCVGVFQFTGGGPAAPASAPSATKVVKGKGSFGGPKNVVPKDALDNAMGTGVPVDPRGTAANGGTKVATNFPAPPVLNERDPFDGDKYMPADAKPKQAPAPVAAKPAPKFKGGPSVGPMSPLKGPDGFVLGGPGATAIKPLDTFDYSVSGVVTGDRPAAVFQDSKGNQRLVTLGSSLDGDTKVVAIERGKVTVQRHGKNTTMTVGANNPTEKRSDEK